MHVHFAYFRCSRRESAYSQVSSDANFQTLRATSEDTVVSRSKTPIWASKTWIRSSRTFIRCMSWCESVNCNAKCDRAFVYAILANGTHVSL